MVEESRATSLRRPESSEVALSRRSNPPDLEICHIEVTGHLARWFTYLSVVDDMGCKFAVFHILHSKDTRGHEGFKDTV